MAGSGKNGIGKLRAGSGVFNITTGNRVPEEESEDLSMDASEESSEDNLPLDRRQLRDDIKPLKDELGKTAMAIAASGAPIATAAIGTGAPFWITLGAAVGAIAAIPLYSGPQATFALAYVGIGAAAGCVATVPFVFIPAGIAHLVATGVMRHTPNLVDEPALPIRTAANMLRHPKTALNASKHPHREWHSKRNYEQLEENDEQKTPNIFPKKNDHLGIIEAARDHLIFTGAANTLGALNTAGAAITIGIIAAQPVLAAGTVLTAGALLQTPFALRSLAATAALGYTGYGIRNKTADLVRKAINKINPELVVAPKANRGWRKIPRLLAFGQTKDVVKPTQGGTTKQAILQLASPILAATRDTALFASMPLSPFYNAVTLPQKHKNREDDQRPLVEQPAVQIQGEDEGGQLVEQLGREGEPAQATKHSIVQPSFKAIGTALTSSIAQAPPVAEVTAGTAAITASTLPVIGGVAGTMGVAAASFIATAAMPPSALLAAGFFAKQKIGNIAEQRRVARLNADGGNADPENPADIDDDQSSTSSNHER